MEYSTAIVREFRKEFPIAKLTVAYDIACRMKTSIEVQILRHESRFNYLGCWSKCS